MTVVVESREDLTLEHFERVVFGEEDVEIGERAFRRMASSRASGLRLPDAGEAPSPPSRPPTAADDRVDCAGWVAGPSFGGAVLAQRVVRGIVFARLANFVDGHVRARPVIAERIASMLDGSPLPEVPTGGQVGPGEIMTLLGVMTSISGSLEGIERTALVSGSPCAAALAADVAVIARHRLDAVTRTFALAVEAFGAPLDAYDDALDELWVDEYEQRALGALRRHLEDTPRCERARHQPAPVSVRIIPRVLGQAHRAGAALEHAARVSLVSVTGDSIYLPPDARHPDGRVVVTGGSHNGVVYPAMSALASAWADVVFLAERLVTALHVATNSLPRRDGVRNSLFSWVAGSVLEQAREAAATTLLLPGSADAQNDVASPTFAAYGKLERSGTCVDAALALLSASASRSLWETKLTPPRQLQPLLAGVRLVVPPVDPDPDRAVGAELAELAGIFGAAALSGRLLFRQTSPASPESARDIPSSHGRGREESPLPHWWWGPE